MIVFNQPLLVPSFMNANKRELLSRDQVDMTKIIDLKMEINSDINPKNLKYNLMIKEWTSLNLTLDVNFENP